VRKFFFVFGIGCACLIAAAAAGFGYLAFLGSGLDKESKAYADSTVVAVTSHWDPQALDKLASPILAHAASADQMRSMFDWFGTLGPLTNSKGCVGSSAVYASVGQQRRTTAQYLCEARYQQGMATVQLSLIKIDKAWMVEGFRVNSDFLLAHRPVQKL
jgi:hypothetical protein